MSLSRNIALTCIASALSLASPAVQAAVTHATANLNLRAGPGTHYRINTTIPAGSAIDVHNCTYTWCYALWGPHHGYVNRDHLMHHVTVEVYPIVHVTHVHHHSIF